MSDWKKRRTKKISVKEIARIMQEESAVFNEWVSVKDRLPEKHGWYLTAHKKTYPTDSGMKVRFFCHGRFMTDKIEVTHWRPLPEYPESE